MRLACWAFFLSAAALWAQPPVDGTWSIPGGKAKERFAREALPSSAAALSPVAPVTLPPLDLATERVANRRGQIPIGVTRPVESPRGEWTELSAGRAVWRAAVESPEAKAIRVHFVRFSAGRGRVWVYGAAGEVEGPYRGGGLYEDGDFWSGTVSGSRIVIEYEPEAAAPRVVPFLVDAVAHFWQEPVSGAELASLAPLHRFEPDLAVLPLGLAAAGERFLGSCHLDYRCYSEWAQAGSGVAHIAFQSSEDNRFYVCSGALLNTRSSSLRPYFLTANHCLSDDREARSVQTYWFYETAQCNGPAVTRGVATRVDGARFLAGGGQGEGDFSLVELDGLPDRPVWFAGWQVTEPDFGAALVSIHHPGGSFKRMAFGTRAADRNALVDGVLAPANRYLQVLMNEGRIAGGSSGSPLYDGTGRVVGNLSYGPEAPPGQTECDVSNFRAGYGRFASAYPALRSFLEDGPSVNVTVTPATLTFRGADGVIAPPARQTLRIETASAAAVSFTATPSTAWIRLSATAGAVSATAPATLEVSIDTARLPAAGAFTGNVTVQAAGALPVAVSVRADLGASRASVVASVTPNPVYEQDPDRDGFRWFFELRLQERAGLEARVSTLRIGGQDYSARIVEWFGSDRLPALGSLAVSLRSRDIPTPSDSLFEIGGLDAANQAWSQSFVVQFLGRRRQAELRLVSDPETVARDPGSGDCAWRHSLTLTETAAVGVTLTRWVAGSHDLSGEIATWFGSTRLEPLGRLRTGICWRGLIVPATIPFEVAGADDHGNPVRVTAQVRFVGAAGEVPVLSVTPALVNLASPSGSLTQRVTLSLGGQSVSWRARVDYQGDTSGWLTAVPLSGTSDASILLSVSSLTAGRLAAGAYQATLVIEAPGAAPARIEVPVHLRIGGSAPPPPQFSSGSVVNAASFRDLLAPGMLFTIAGTNLSQTEAFATRLPLPSSLGGTVVRVNGVLCPLLYVSARQINAQLPYEVRPGAATVTISVGGSESSANVTVSAVAPGVFTIDGSRPAPQWQGRRGEILIAYATGVGFVSPGVPTGDGPVNSAPELMPRPQLPVQVTVGGVPAEILFAGIPPGIVGAIQINYRIPSSAPLGDADLVVSVGGVAAPPLRLRVLN